MKNLIKGALDNINIEKFLTLPDERLILSVRKHWFTVVPPISMAVFGAFVFMSISFFLFLRTSLFTFPIFISSIMALLALSLLVISKIIIDWHYHFYIVSTRRILEITCTPLFSYNACDVLLDQ